MRWSYDECVVAAQDWNTLDFLLLTLKVLVSKQNKTGERGTSGLKQEILSEAIFNRRAKATQIEFTLRFLSGGGSSILFLPISSAPSLK